MIAYGERCLPSLDEFESILSAVAHRGPDDRRIAQGSGFVLGHHRLTIVGDEHIGRQPYFSADGRFVLVYSGEIFNYGSIKTRFGWRNVCDSDTAVLMKLWEEFGPDCLSYLEGQFAFAVLETRSLTLYLVRDRFGIKPIYWARRSGVLAFASDIPAVLKGAGVVGKVSPDGVVRHLAFRHPVAPMTIFQNVFQVCPGEVVRVDRDTHTSKRYWRVSLRCTERGDPEFLRRLVSQSVAKQMPQDNVGVFVSGGIDSSILATEAVAISSRRQRVTAYTANFLSFGQDESAQASEYCRTLPMTCIEVGMPLGTYWDDADALMRLRCQPLAMHNEVPIFLLAKRASGDGKVVFCGEGADELFWGYSRIFRVPFEGMRRTVLTRAKHCLGCFSDPGQTSDSFSYFMERYLYFSINELKMILRSRFWPNAERVPLALFEPYRFGCQRSVADGISMIFLELHLPGLLAMVDANAMAAGVEVRVPFLDEALVDYAINLKASDKLAWRSTLQAILALFEPVDLFSGKRDCAKAILKRSYGRTLPQQILQRPKNGFSVPVNQFLQAFPGWNSGCIESPIWEVLCPEGFSAWYTRGRRDPTERFLRQVHMLACLSRFFEVL